MRIEVTEEKRDLETTIATDQTDGEPPSLGSTILVNIGSMAKIKNAEETARMRMTRGRIVAPDWRSDATGLPRARPKSR